LNVQYPMMKMVADQQFSRIDKCRPTRLIQTVDSRSGYVRESPQEFAADCGTQNAIVAGVCDYQRSIRRDFRVAGMVQPEPGPVMAHGPDFARPICTWVGDQDAMVSGV
jgi:hypothetical protein